MYKMKPIILSTLRVLCAMKCSTRSGVSSCGVLQSYVGVCIQSQTTPSRFHHTNYQSETTPVGATTLIRALSGVFRGGLCDES